MVISSKIFYKNLILTKKLSGKIPPFLLAIRIYAWLALWVYYVETECGWEIKDDKNIFNTIFNAKFLGSHSYVDLALNQFPAFRKLHLPRSQSNRFLNYQLETTMIGYRCGDKFLNVRSNFGTLLDDADNFDSFIIQS